MKPTLLFVCLLLLTVAPGRAARLIDGGDDFLDRLDGALSFAAVQEQLRARVSGTLDLEFYHFSGSAPGLIETRHPDLFNPRLTFFLDSQLGPRIYLFAQARVDRGFDPAEHAEETRLDEYAIRFTPWEDGRLSLQVGKFSTVVGTWVGRHLSWDNPFINAPLLYENPTQIEDVAAPPSARDFHSGFKPAEKYEYNPVIWGPDYTTGFSAGGRLGKIDYAAELKNASLSSHPRSWDATEIGFQHPTFSGRIGYRPSAAWNFGFSASAGPYFRPEATPTLPQGRGVGAYHEYLLGQDVSYAWHHLQLWAEFYEVRFQVPRLGDADTFAYFVEGRYQLTPQLFAALRWNQQIFGTVVDDRGGQSAWGRDASRIDAALAYRFTPHTQLKVQYALGRDDAGRYGYGQTIAAQFTVRF